MKKVILSLASLCLFAITSFAQTAPTNPTNIYAIGGSFNQGATPQLAGTALYAHSVNDSGTYAATVIDILPSSGKPFTVNTNIEVGIAQKLFTIGKIPFYAPATTGFTFNGQNAGWNWATGGLASIKIGKNLRFMPNFRVVKSSVGGSGYQPIVGVLFGWGQ